MKKIPTFEKFINESRSKRNTFLGVFPPSKDVFQRIIKKVSPSEIEDLIKYTEDNGDNVERSGENAWGSTKESMGENQAVWQYLDGKLYYENPNYQTIYDEYINKKF